MKSPEQINRETHQIALDNPELTKRFKEYKRFRARAVARTALREVGILQGFDDYMEVKLEEEL